MIAAEAIVAAARGAIGVRFRPHGRDPAYGLDCVGLAALAVGAAGRRVTLPVGYRLRSDDVGQVERLLAAAGLVPVANAAAGDVLLLRAGAGQLHLAIRTGDGIVHADASLRRVVERPGTPPWPVIACWRDNGEGTSWRR